MMFFLILQKFIFLVFTTFLMNKHNVRVCAFEVTIFCKTTLFCYQYNKMVKDKKMETFDSKFHKNKT